MDPHGSVTQLIGQLQSDDPGLRQEAARDLWERYAPALLNLARRQLDRRFLRRENEDDVIQSMYASFCGRQERGGFDLNGRDELWKLLVTVTLRKARNAARRHRRDARDYRREACIADEDAARLLREWEPSEPGPTPSEVAAFNDELERRMRCLGDPVLRHIAQRKLEGYTNKEIARELNDCTERTIERKLARIRAKWARVDEAGD